MRVKIGKVWFECHPDQPIMVELTPQDKVNIANMHPDDTKYALFDDNDQTTKEQKLAWMET